MRNFFKNIKAKIIRAAVLMQEKRGENFVDSGTLHLPTAYAQDERRGIRTDK